MAARLFSEIKVIRLQASFTPYLTGYLGHLFKNQRASVNAVLLHHFAEGLGEPVIEKLVASDVFPKRRAAQDRVVRVYSLVKCRQTLGLAVEDTDDKIIDLQPQAVDARLVHKVLKMTEDCSNVILIDSLRTCFALAKFASAVNCVDELYVNAIHTRRATDDLLQLGNEDLNVLPKARVEARPQYPRVDKGLREAFGFSVATKERRKVIYEERVDVKEPSRNFSRLLRWLGMIVERNTLSLYLR